MDNLEQSTEPVGAEGATSSQDNSSVSETQAVETEEVVSANESEEAEAAPTYPWQAEEKFKDKTPEEIFNSYKELESKIGQLGQKATVADLLQDKFGVSPEHLKSVIERQEQEKLQQQYQENPGAFAVQKVQELESKLALKEVENELDTYLSSEEGKAFAPFRDKIFNIGLNLEKDTPFAEIAQEYFGQAMATGQQGAYKKIETKQKTQPTGVTSAPKRKLGLEEMATMSSTELAAILPHAPQM